MAQGRFDNPIEAALTGFYDRFRPQTLEPAWREVDLSGKTVLITGANSGVGFGAAVDCAKRGARVLMACRSGHPEAGEKVRAASGSATVEMLRVDLSDVHSTDALCDELARRHREDGLEIDAFIGNAGVAPPESRRSAQQLDQMLHVNILANVQLAARMLADGVIPNRSIAGNGRPPGQPRPRMIFVSSDSHRGAGPVEVDELGVWVDYGVSGSIHRYSYFKLVLNAWATELGRRLRDRDGVDVAVHITCPGPVATNIHRDAPPPLRAALSAIFGVIFASIDEGARPLTLLAGGEAYEGRTNVYLHTLRERRMDEQAYDRTLGEALAARFDDLIDQARAS